MADQWAKADSVLQWKEYGVSTKYLSSPALMSEPQNEQCQLQLSMNTWRKNIIYMIYRP